MGKLDGRIAWVTGSGSGIGEAAAMALAEEGAVLVLTGRRQAPLEEVAGRIRAKGGTAHVEPADLMQAPQVDAVVGRIVERLGRLDLMVSNAGLNITERNWKTISPAGIDGLIHGNLSSAFYCGAGGAAGDAGAGRRADDPHRLHGRPQRQPDERPGLYRRQARGGGDEPQHQHGECVNGIRSTAFCPGEVNTPILKKRPNPLSAEDLAKMLQPEDCGDLIRYIACLPPHVTMNEVWLTPSFNRGYVAALGRKL